MNLNRERRKEMKRFATLASLLVLAIAASPALAEDFQARARVVHASPDPTPSVDVIANGALTLFEDVEFGEVTDYLPVDANVYFIEVVETGTSGPAAFDANLRVFYSTDYTVIATDELASITPVVLVDDNSYVSSDMTRVRLFHGSPDTDPVVVRAVDGPFWFGEPVGFQNASPYVMVPAGTYDLEVTLAGTTTSLVIPDAAFPGGSVVTLFAIGRLGDGSITVLPSVDATFDDMGDDDDDDDDDEDDDSPPRWRDFWDRYRDND
jgi:hypothetical protein